MLAPAAATFDWDTAVLPGVISAVNTVLTQDGVLPSTR